MTPVRSCTLKRICCFAQALGIGQGDRQLATERSHLTWLTRRHESVFFKEENKNQDTPQVAEKKALGAIGDESKGSND